MTSEAGLLLFARIQLNLRKASSLGHLLQRILYMTRHAVARSRLSIVANQAPAHARSRRLYDGIAVCRRTVTLSTSAAIVQKIAMPDLDPVPRNRRPPDNAMTAQAGTLIDVASLKLRRLAGFGVRIQPARVSHRLPQGRREALRRVTGHASDAFMWRTSQCLDHLTPVALAASGLTTHV